MAYRSMLLRIIQNLEQDFDTNELAYLALTGKIEKQIRDKIAFKLHHEICRIYLICREWIGMPNNRTDLAIIRKSNLNPACLLELKAHSGFGYGGAEYQDAIGKDFRKMFEVATEESEMYYVFINSFPHNIIEEPYDKAVKYSIGFNRDFNRLLNMNNDIENAIEILQEQVIYNWHKYLYTYQFPGGRTELEKEIPGDKTTLKKLNGGTYYGKNVSLYIFFYGPVYRRELIRHNGLIQYRN